MLTDEQKAADLKAARTITRVIRLGISFVLFFLIVYYGSALYLGSSLSNSPQIIAHRGGPASQPENTMAAFRQAIKDGVAWLEFDVQMTKDGFLVVIHDETVDRTTNGTGLVGDFSLADLQSLDAGDGERVPTFAEVIALAKREGVGILPEAKSPELYPGIEAKMVEEILIADYLEYTIIQSFNMDTLVAIHQINVDVELCPLYGLWELSVEPHQPGSAGYVCPMAEMVLLNPGLIRDAHNAGLRVFVWFGVIENPTIMQLMLDFGADGLMVDDQMELIELVRPEE